MKMSTRIAAHTVRVSNESSIRKAALEVYANLPFDLKHDVDVFLRGMFQGVAPDLERSSRELYEAYEPVRAAVRRQHGSKVTLYRGEPKDKPPLKRKFLSWTPYWKLASHFATRKGFEVVEAEVRSSDVVAVLASPKAPGYIEYLVRDRPEYHIKQAEQVPLLGYIEGNDKAQLGWPTETVLNGQRGYWDFDPSHARNEFPKIKRVVESVGGKVLKNFLNEDDESASVTVLIPSTLPVKNEAVKVGPYLVRNVRPYPGESLRTAARSLRVDAESIQKLRKEFLALAKNIPRVKDDRDLDKLREAFRVFRTRFDRIFFEEWLNKAFKYDESIRNKVYHENNLRENGWTFYLELSWPRRFWGERKKWHNRLKAKARPLWKALEDFVRDQGGSHDIEREEITQMELEGFKVRIVGTPGKFSSIEKFKEGLRIFKKRAEKVFPPMLRMMLPLHLTAEGRLDEGGSYHRRYIKINLVMSEKNPHRVAHVIAHEMGHHIYRNYLGSNDRKFWDATVRGNYQKMTPAEIDLALKLWPDGAWLHEMPEKLKDVDPTLAIQLSLIGWGHGNRRELSTKEEFQALLDRGETLSVPKNPITGYAGKNSEEAFCEVMGRLVGYGPRTVDPLVLSWFRLILPSIRVASKVTQSKEWWLAKAALEEGHEVGVGMPERIASRFLEAKDKVPGGLADKKKPSDFDPKQLAKGVQVEKEHTDDPEMAREIAMDHLTEDPKYYDKLETIEKVAARYKEKKRVPSQDGGETTVYVYSERQIADRNRKKAERVEKLGKAIEKLRSKVKKDMKSKDPNISLAALAVNLMDLTAERVGNQESAKNNHLGVTGWKKENVTFSGGSAIITYTGKSGVKHKKTVTDKTTVSALKAIHKDLGSDDACILSWDEGCIKAEDVNAYLKPFDITAKDIRGYHANTEMKSQLKKVRSGTLPSDKKEREKQLKAEFKEALEETAKAVGHEPSTLNSHYLSPGLEDEYLKDGTVKTAHRHYRIACGNCNCTVETCRCKSVGKEAASQTGERRAMLRRDGRPRGIVKIKKGDQP